jgi:aminopeptidase N
MQKGLLLFFLLFATLVKSQNMDVLHYRFSIELNDHTDSLYGKAEIKAVAKATGAVQLDLVQRSGGKGMEVTKVEKDDNPGPYPFSQKNNKLILPILKGIPGDTLRFRIFYSGIPDDGLIISKNKFGDRTFFGDNWPNRAHHWLPCVDRPDDKASVEFLVTAPSQYAVISNGVKLEEKELENSKRLTHWREETPLPTKVMVIGVAKFAVKTFDDSSTNLPVSAWVYPQDSAKGFYDYAQATEIVRFFSDYIAPFPFRKLANVQSTTIFGGMENASCIFYDEKTVAGDRSSEDLLAHEIAHQWFGNMASEKSFAHLWLSEGFATYMTDLYFEKKYGKEAARERLQKEREEVLDFARSSKNTVVDSTTNLMSLLNANSYQKGSWVLHMLRNEVGDTVFHRIVQTYYNQYKGSNAETKDFEAVAEKVSGKDLKWFFDQWLYRSGVPKLYLSQHDSGAKTNLRILQMGNFYRLPLTLLLTTKSGQEKRQSIVLTKPETTLEITLPNQKIQDVVLDPDSEILFERVTGRRRGAPED